MACCALLRPCISNHGGAVRASPGPSARNYCTGSSGPIESDARTRPIVRYGAWRIGACLALAGRAVSLQSRLCRKLVEGERGFQPAQWPWRRPPAAVCVCVCKTGRAASAIYDLLTKACCIPVQPGRRAPDTTLDCTSSQQSTAGQDGVVAMVDSIPREALNNAGGPAP